MFKRKYHVATYIGGPYDGRTVSIRIRKDGTFPMPIYGKPEKHNGKVVYGYIVRDGNYYHSSLITQQA